MGWLVLSLRQFSGEYDRKIGALNCWTSGWAKKIASFVYKRLQFVRWMKLVLAWALLS
jgi:hypothetical protein